MNFLQTLNIIFLAFPSKKNMIQWLETEQILGERAIKKIKDKKQYVVGLLLKSDKEA